MFKTSLVKSFGLVLIALVLLIGTTAPKLEAKTQNIRVTLDWTPNTNHTGLYVAKELDYFADEGLKVKVVQPSKTTAVQLTASGRTEFGVSHQESVTMARDRGIPVVSIAAIIQENTSGFAAPADTGIESVKNFEEHKFGGWGMELYNKIIRSVMKEAGADFSTVSFVNLGMTDFVTAARKGMGDFFWIFYGWQGIHAELAGLDFNYIPARDLSETFNYYTPVFISSEGVIRKKPELVEKFLRAVTRGYEYSMENPEESAEILLDHATELDRELVMKSQKFLANEYGKGVDRWGVQEKSVWIDFTNWLYENGLIDKRIPVEEAFTNEFLPEE